MARPTKPKFVFAKSSMVTGTPDGYTVRLTKGDAWLVSDPLVEAKPELFSSVPPTVHRRPRRNPQQLNEPPEGQKAGTPTPRG